MIRFIRFFKQFFGFSLLSSLNLPAAIECNDASSGLPPSILEKANTVKESGGISELQRYISELPELLKRNEDILDEVSSDLN